MFAVTVVCYDILSVIVTDFPTFLWCTTDHSVVQGDFDGDGKTDILWRNALSSQTVIWFMNGTQKTGAVTSLNQSSNFDFQTIGDYNSDGKADILWRNSLTGATQIWYMNGQTVSSVGNLTAPSATGLNIVQ